MSDHEDNLPTTPPMLSVVHDIDERRERDTEAPPGPDFGAIERDTARRRDVFDEISQIRGLLSPIAEAVKRIEGKVDGHAEELGEIKTHQSRLALGHAILDGMVVNGLEGKRVLIADDDTALCVMMRRFLRQLGCDTSVATSREQAERLLGVEDFHVAIVDLHMPHSADGIELCRWINKAYPEIALIVTSGAFEPELLDRIPAARLAKPLEAQALKDLLYEVLGLVPRSPDTEPAPAPFAPIEPTTQNSPDSPVPVTQSETPDAKRAED